MTGIAGLSLGTRLLGIRSALAKIPPKAWMAIAGAMALIVGLIWHRHQIHALIASSKAEQRKADDAAWQAAFDKMHAVAVQRRLDLERQSRMISDQQRKLNDEENSRIAAGADDLRLHGPGKAAPGCRSVDHPGISSSSGQSLEASGQRTDAAADQMPSADGQSAVVPWGWLVGRAEQADLDRAEVLTWRNWYRQQAAAWPKQSSGD